jgi:dihydrofolate reductase
MRPHPKETHGEPHLLDDHLARRLRRGDGGRPRHRKTAHTEPDQPRHILQYARDWQAAEKVVYSTTLDSVSSAKTRIERTFDPAAARKLKPEADHDLTVDGPNLAAQAIAAGLVDEYHLFITTSVVGGGKRFFPDGVRLDLELVDERAFDSGLIYARYRTR